MEKQHSKADLLKLAAGSIIVTAAGCIVLPPLINKLSLKLYKASIRNDTHNQETHYPAIIPLKDEVIEETPDSPDEEEQHG